MHLAARSLTPVRTHAPQARRPERSAKRAARLKTASGAAQRWGANRREKGDRARLLRLYAYSGPNGRTAKRCNLRRSDRRRSAARPVLEHLALEAIVVGGVCRAAGDVGGVVVAM